MKLHILDIIGLTLMLTGAVRSDYDMVNDLTFKLSGLRMEFPSEGAKTNYLSSGRYIARNVLATRIQIYNDLAVVALPRYYTLLMLKLVYYNCSLAG